MYCWFFGSSHAPQRNRTKMYVTMKETTLKAIIKAINVATEENIMEINGLFWKNNQFCKRNISIYIADLNIYIYCVTREINVIYQ